MRLPEVYIYRATGSLLAPKLISLKPNGVEVNALVAPLVASHEGPDEPLVREDAHSLASGRFAMIDNGLSFQLVPWSPSLDSQIGKHISGVMRAGGGVECGGAQRASNLRKWKLADGPRGSGLVGPCCR